MQKINQYLSAGGDYAQPNAIRRAFNDLFSRQCLSGSGWNVGTGLLVARTGALNTVAIVGGATVVLAANTSAPALTGFALTPGQFAAVITTTDGGGVLRNYFTSIEVLQSAIRYPQIPITEAVIGVVHLAPTVAFTGGVTNLDLVGVNASFSSVLGPFSPQNIF